LILRETQTGPERAENRGAAPAAAERRIDPDGDGLLLLWRAASQGYVTVLRL
jgi:hypothetical protein